MLAGAGFFLLLSSSLSLLQQSLLRNDVSDHRGRYDQLPSSHAGSNARMSPRTLKVAELTAATNEIDQDTAKAARILGRFDNMVLEPGKRFLLILPNHRQLRYDNSSADPMIIKSSVSGQHASLVFYKATY
jgi:hypothetical protein